MTGNGHGNRIGGAGTSDCTDCPGRAEVHLVEREAEPHDPQHHLVVRVVAPRAKSDARDYDHPAWVRSAITRLLGPASG